MNTDKLFWVILLSSILIIPAGYLAAFPKTDADFALLPPYCKARYGKTNSADAENWKRRIGRLGWVHIHHYCSALDHRNKANMASDEETRIKELRGAIGGFTYMQENAPRDFILQPEISTQKGRVYLRLNQDGAALKEFYDAIKLNPKYVPAYSELGDYYIDHNEPEEAKKILGIGLKQNPNSKSLKRRLDKI
jgi:tetratricopeptide (TPR) repeat protein